MELPPSPVLKGHKTTTTVPPSKSGKQTEHVCNLTYHLFVILLQQVKKGEEREGRRVRKGLNKILTEIFKHTSNRDKLGRGQMQYYYILRS